MKISSLKVISISLFLFSIVNFSFAQNQKVSGYVKNGKTGEAIPYANVSLMRALDSSFVDGRITDTTGMFKLERVKKGNYHLKVSFIGYETVFISNFQIHKNDTVFDNILLNTLSTDLGEVNIAASKIPVSYKIDRKVIDASAFPSADVAMDLLENIPSVQVDFEGKLTYRGDGKFLVYINGHPVSNGEEKLRQIPTSRIDKIEVITNPSAIYDAEGTAGIIQVILKRNRLEGFSIGSNLRANTRGSKQWLFGIDQKGDKGGWYVGGHVGRNAWSKYKITDVKNISQGDNLFTTTFLYDHEGGGDQSYIEMGANYDLTDKDYIDFQMNINPFKNTNYSYEDGEVHEVFTENGQTVKSNYLTQSRMDAEYRYFGGILTYEHAFNKKRTHLLKTYVDYSTYLHDFDEQQIDSKIFDDYMVKEGFIGVEENETFVEAKLIYSAPVGKERVFETGFEVNTDHIPKVTSTSGFYNTDDELIPYSNERLNQAVDFYQDIYSAFATFKNELEKFSYQIGLRVEHTRRKSDYSYNSENESFVVPAKHNFTDVFPSIHFNYNLTETHQMALSYSRRIERPHYWSLIPLVQYESLNTYYTGNGDLMPAYTNAFEINYKKSWDSDFIGFELFARQTSDVIQTFYRADSASFLRSSPENVGNSMSLGAELMFGFDVSDWWNTNLSASLFSYKLDIESDESTTKQLMSTIRWNNTFSLPKQFSIKWDLHYNSPRITAQSKRTAYFVSNLAVKKSFANKKWQLMVAASNIFNSSNYDIDRMGSNFTHLRLIKNIPYLSFRLTFLLDKQK